MNIRRSTPSGMRVRRFHNGGKGPGHPHDSKYSTDPVYTDKALVEDSGAPRGTTYNPEDNTMSAPNYITDASQRIKNQLFMESGGERNPNTAVSPAGAQGKWQVMPGTKIDLEDRGFIPKGLDPFDPNDSKIMRDGKIAALLKTSFISNPPQAIPEVNKLARIYASYNYGEGRTRKTLERAKADGVDIYGDPLLWLDYLPHETKKYVNNILYEDKMP